MENVYSSDESSVINLREGYQWNGSLAYCYSICRENCLCNEEEDLALWTGSAFRGNFGCSHLNMHRLCIIYWLVVVALSYVQLQSSYVISCRIAISAMLRLDSVSETETVW